jgi:hypothetical protein
VSKVPLLRAGYIEGVVVAMSQTTPEPGGACDLKESCHPGFFERLMENWTVLETVARSDVGAHEEGITCVQ